MPTPPPGTPTIDLTLSGSSGALNGAAFMTGDLQLSGPGFDAFVQIQNQGSEQGYNSDHSSQFDEKPPSNSVLLAEVPIVIGDGTNGTEEGVAYREFLFELNEPNGLANPYLSLDALQIWQEESGNLSNFTPGTGFAGAHTNHLAYDLDANGDHWVGLTDGMVHGSGLSEYRVLIRNDLFINDAQHRYVTLYSQFGLQSGWASGGGFEEWGLGGPSGGTVSSLALTKTATVPGGTADTVGEVISYTFRLDNTGNTSQTGVTLTDPAVSDLTRVADIIGNNDNVLNVGEVWSYTAHYTVTQNDLDTNAGGGGIIINTATADSNQATPVTASASVVVEQSSTLEVTKTADVTDVDQAGDVINYLISVTNTGTATQTNPVVTDPQFSLVTPIIDEQAPVLGPELLAPLLVGDYNIGDTNQNGFQDPGETFQFVNAGDTNQNGVLDPGETFIFTNIGDTNQNGAQDTGETFQFYNAGDTNHNGVEDNGETFQFDVSHQLAGIDGDHDDFNDGDVNHDGQLNVGETWQYSVSYTVTQADIDNGGVVDLGLTHDNTASVSTDQLTTHDASASVTIVQNPHVTLVKDATVADGTADSVGDVINYAIAVTNDGNMTLTDLVVSDPTVSDLAAVESGGFNAGDTDQDGKLDLGETWQYTATHTVTQADIDNGGVVDPLLTYDNTASVATGQGASADDNASVAIVQNPHVTLVKDATVADGTADSVGDVINYAITVTNDGNMTLTDPLVSDPTVSDLTRGTDIVGNNDNVLDAGETWSYTASHTVTQADIDNGGVVDPLLTYDNTASVTTAQNATDDDTVAVPIVQNPHVVLVKDATVADGTADTAGDVINYAITVANDGNMTLTDPLVSDPTVSDLTRGTDIVGNNDNVLDTGETWSYTASHTVTQTEIDNGGSIDNTASVTTDQGATASDNASVTVQQPLPALTLDLSLTQFVDIGPSGPDTGGDLVQFFIGLTNNTNGTITNIDVSDLLGDAVAANLQTPIPASLASGAQWTTTFNHFLTAADVAANHVIDDVTVTALDGTSQTQTVTTHWDTLL